LLRKGVNLSFFKGSTLAQKFAFISEVKHIPGGPKKCNFLEVEKKGGSMTDKKERVGKHWIGAERTCEGSSLLNF